jgi:hypothetical protein
MPDFERVLRALELNLSDNKEYIKGKHFGLDCARWQIVKILLACLLLAVLAGTAWGQTTIYREPNVKGFTIIHSPADTGIIPKPFVYDYRTQPITWGELEAYLEYCHNDSTLWERHKANTGCIHDRITGRCLIASHWTDFWKHKQPTLPGLMAWKRR